MSSLDTIQQLDLEVLLDNVVMLLLWWREGSNFCAAVMLIDACCLAYSENPLLEIAACFLKIQHLCEVLNWCNWCNAPVVCCFIHEEFDDGILILDAASCCVAHLFYYWARIILEILILDAAAGSLNCCYSMTITYCLFELLILACIHWSERTVECCCFCYWRLNSSDLGLLLDFWKLLLIV